MIDNVHAPTNFQTTMVAGASEGNPKDLLILGLNLKDLLGTLTIIKGTILHTSLYLTRIEAGASFYGSRFGNKPFYNNAASGILGTSPPRPQLYNSSSMPSCQVCGKYGHLVDTWRFRNVDAFVNEGCQICGKKNIMLNFVTSEMQIYKTTLH